MNKLKFLFVIGFTLSVFSGCSSDAPVMPSVEVEPEAKLYDVTFTVDDFTTDIGTRNAAKRNLTYWIYDDSNIIKQGNIAPTDRTDELKVQLMQGSYKITIVTSDDRVSSLTEPPVKSSSVWSMSKSFISYENLKNDIFMGTSSFTITDEPLNKSITLTRPITKINLRINDLHKIPASVNKVVPIFYRDVQSGEVVLPVGINPMYHKSMYLKIPPYGVQTFKSMDAIGVSKDKLHLYNENNPISFYFPQNVDYRFLYDSQPKGSMDLYLLGITDTIAGINPLFVDDEHVVFAKLLQKDIQLKPNQSLTIQGSIFQHEGLSLEISDQWGETTNIDF
ncbi:MAG: hypothetical protein RL662_1250 [Bacteroidota bacterium]